MKIDHWGAIDYCCYLDVRRITRCIMDLVEGHRYSIGIEIRATDSADRLQGYRTVTAVRIEDTGDACRACGNNIVVGEITEQQGACAVVGRKDCFRKVQLKTRLPFKCYCRNKHRCGLVQRD